LDGGQWIAVLDRLGHRLAHQREKSLAVLRVRDTPLGNFLGTAQA